MTETPTYQELALVLAQHVHTHYYRPVGYYFEVPGQKERQLGQRTIFDNCSTSDLENLTSVLVSLGILKELDPSRSEFTCPPEAFAGTIEQTWQQGEPFDQLVEGLLYLMEFFEKDERLIDLALRLGLCRRLSPAEQSAGITPEELSLYQAKKQAIKDSGLTPTDASIAITELDKRTSEELGPEKFGATRITNLRNFSMVVYGPIVPKDTIVWTERRDKYDNLRQELAEEKLAKEAATQAWFKEKKRS